MLKTSKRADFDPERSAFFMPSGSGPCRFGQYHRFHRMVLSEHGFDNVPIYAPNQDDKLYNELNILGGKFMRLGWRAIVATDLLIKMLHETRPYEKNQGETDRVYTRAALRHQGGHREGRGRGVRRPRGCGTGVPRHPKTGAQKPVVGIVGEIYIRSNRFGNNGLVRKVEEFGERPGLRPSPNG